MSKRKCSGALNEKKNLPSREGLITYRTRERARTSDRLFQEKVVVLALETDSGRKDAHREKVLKNMLQLTDASSGGGIDDCITDALIYLSPTNVQRPYTTNVTKDSARSKNRYTHRQYKAVTKPEAKVHELEDADANKIKCQKTFYNILCSEKFLLLCNLVSEGIKVEKLFDIRHLDSKMKSGVYGQSPGVFFEDLQQIWEKFRRIGEEMVILACSLSDMSKEVSCDKVEEDLVREACPQNSKQSCMVGSAAKHSDISISGTQFTQLCKCKTCGLKADENSRLICDACDVPYHPSCLKPAIKDIPTKSWNEDLHDNCTVCEKLEFVTEGKEPLIANVNTSAESSAMIPNTSRESSISSMVTDEAPEISRTALSRLCKRCGTCEDEDKKFLICGHAQCPYKYFHIRCLKTSEIASHQQINRQCWYCPSCLCRDCFLDRDDESIVLCDGCDEAHHIYCMKPPRSSVPKGQWYCLRCNVEKAKQGMRRYEQWVLQLHGKKV